MAAHSSTSAHSLVQEQVAEMLVTPLEAASVVLSSGATILNSSEPLRVPTVSGDTAPAWVGENEEIPDATGPSFGEIELMPTSRKSIKTITRVSNELVRMAKFGISEILQNKLVTDVRTKLDTALLAGDGADNSVTGILNQSGLDSAPLDPTNPDTVLDALAALAANEVVANRLILSGADFFEMRKLKDSTGRYLLQPDPTQAAAYMLQGVPVTVTNKLPKGKGVLADMSQVAVVRDTDPTVTVLPERYAEFDQTGIRVTTRYDLGILRNEGVIILDAAA